MESKPETMGTARYAVLDVLTREQERRGMQGLMSLDVLDRLTAYLGRAATSSIQRRYVPARKTLSPIEREVASPRICRI